MTCCSPPEVSGKGLEGALGPSSSTERTEVNIVELSLGSLSLTYLAIFMARYMAVISNDLACERSPHERQQAHDLLVKILSSIYLSELLDLDRRR